MKFVLYSLATISLSILSIPFIPAILFSFQQNTYKEAYYTFQTSASQQPIYDMPNSLIIPQIGVQVAIVEGAAEEALWKGAWHIPSTGNPLAGNMVIGGHRFAYLPPNNTTFYNLDKLTMHQHIYVVWNKRIYTYSIDRIYEVSADDTSILTPSNSPTLTLFTCTPLWSSARRLVVSGHLVQ